MVLIPASKVPGDPRLTLANSRMSRLQVIAVALAAALNALDGFNVLSISFASPGISKSWGIDKAALGVVLSMELIGMAAGSILLGIVADRVGRRPTVFGCLLLMASGMVLASTASNLEILSVWRLLTGLGIGGMLSTTNAIAAEFANARRRNLCVAIMAGGFPVGAVVGGSIASFLLSTGGEWQSIFRFGAAVSAMFLPLVWIYLPETLAYLIHSSDPNALDKVNRLLERMGHAPIRSLPEAGEAKSKANIGQLFVHPLALVTILLTAGYFFQIMTFYFLMKWVPKIVTDYGFSPSSAGGVLVWANVGGASGSLLLGLLAQRVSVRLLTILAMLCGAASVVWFGQPHATLAILSTAAGLSGFFLNGANVGLYAIFAQSFPARLRATGTGFIIGLGRGGAALGPIVAGVLLQRGLTVSLVAGILACGSLLGSLALLLLRYSEAELS